MTLTPATADAGCWVVIFASLRSDSDPQEYDRVAARMVELAGQQAGFLGMDSARGADGVGLTLSYWESREAIAAWRIQLEHAQAQRDGRARFYEQYTLRVARVESLRSFGM